MTDKVVTQVIDFADNIVRTGGRAVVKDLDFLVLATDRELAAGGDNIISGQPERIDGSDAAGQYNGVTRSFKHEFVDSKEKHWDIAHAYLEMRAYADVFAVKTSCDVNTSLKEDGHFRVEIGELPGLTRFHATFAYSDWWCRPQFGNDIAEVPNRTQMLLWQTEDGNYGCIMTLVDGGCKCELNSRTGRLGADVILYDSGHNRAEAFAFVGGVDANPYELVKRCAVRGMQITGSPGKVRWEKPYPEMFERVGWCTWNAMYTGINEEKILAKMEHAQKAGFPFGYVLFDDGWSPVKDGQLTSFGADAEKFPKGLRPVVEELKGKYGVREVGVWHTFTGYWGGVHSESDIYKDNKSYIFDSKRGTHIPCPAEASRSFGFWNAWHSRLKNDGIDFVKVDNQGATYHHTRGSMPVGDAAKGQKYGLQASIGLNFNQNVINCMCMLSENAWHWSASNISRNSDDFWPGSVASGTEHARQNIYNSLWYSNFCWPDWDMWWTHHDLAAYHGAMRAISGGPVYVADEIDKGEYDALWPLVLSDGTLLRCDQPGLPTRDSLFADPKTNPVAVKVWNKVGRAGMVLAVNATQGEQTIEGSMKPSDVEGIEGDIFAVREYFSGETRLMGRDEEWTFELGPYGVRLFSLAAVEDGAAVIGLENKYVSPATVAGSSVFSNSMCVSLVEGGKLAAYVDRKVKQVKADGKGCQFSQENKWLSAEIPGSGRINVLIEW